LCSLEADSTGHGLFLGLIESASITGHGLHLKQDSHFRKTGAGLLLGRNSQIANSPIANIPFLGPLLKCCYKNILIFIGP